MSYSIFISYRREDSQIAVSSLHKDLLARFGSNAVFADTASIELGEEWDDRIRKSLEEAKIILVIIGNNWLCAEKDNPSQFRICSPHDWVRKEIETAVNLKKVIVPVLIGEAKLPAHPDLPESVKDLCSIEAHRIALKAGNNEGVETLVEFLERKLKSLVSPDDLKERLENILVDKYEIIRNIGSGNRAKVYLGRDTGLDRQVAIKVNMDPGLNEDFVDTLKDAAKINDCVPNSIPVLGAYVHKEPFHVIMPYLRGGSLRKLINENEGTPLPYNDVKNILMNIGEALIKIHNNGLTHCNVKPSNIILNNYEPYLNSLSRVPKLIAASMIKKISDLSDYPDQSVYREELSYLPPEIFDKKPTNDPLRKRNEKVDQYMLGLLGYELLTGCIPPTVSDITDLKSKGIVAFKPLELLSEIRKDCPYRFSRIIHKMSDYDPDNRYESLEEAVRNIEEVSFDVFEIAKDSYARCLSTKDSGNDFFRSFYREFVKISPEAASKFKAKGIGETESHRQYSILREAIFILLMFGENKLGDNEPNILSRIAEMHNRHNYNVSREAYKSFLDALTATICGLSPDIPEPYDSQCKISKRESDIIKQAWLEALKPGIEYMISKY